MNFLNQVYFNNSVKSYLLVAGIILLVLLFKRFISSFAAATVFKKINKVWPGLKKENFFNLVVGPLDDFLVVVVAVFALDKLVFPKDFIFYLYGHSAQEIAERLGKGIIILTLTRLVLRLVSFIALVLEEKANQTVDARDNQLIVFFRDFLKVIVGMIGILLIIKVCFNQSVGSVLTGLSIVGAALALAAKESLENLIASFIIFFDKPFFTGDVVKVNALTGTVERIGLRSTRIRTADKTLVTVPNKQMVDSVVDNWSLRTERRAEIKLELSSSTPANTLLTITNSIKKLMQQHSEQVINFDVFVKDISRNSIIITVEFFTGAFGIKDFFILKENINLQIKQLLDDNKVEFAGDSSNIIIKEESREG
jgi:MscS family membrane protein